MCVCVCVCLCVRVCRALCVNWQICIAKCYYVQIFIFSDTLKFIFLSSMKFVNGGKIESCKERKNHCYRLLDNRWEMRKRENSEMELREKKLAELGT